MTIKIGKVNQSRQLDDTAVQKSTATVVEKTQGTYKEVLICREEHYIDVGGQKVNVELEDSFSVFVGKTIEQALSLKDITDYTWTEALTEVI